MDEMHAWNEAYIGPVFKAPGRRALPFEATFAQCLRDGVVRIDMGLDVAVVPRGRHQRCGDHRPTPGLSSAACR